MGTERQAGSLLGCSHLYAWDNTSIKSCEFSDPPTRPHEELQRDFVLACFCVKILSNYWPRSGGSIFLKKNWIIRLVLTRWQRRAWSPAFTHPVTVSLLAPYGQVMHVFNHGIPHAARPATHLTRRPWFIHAYVNPSLGSTGVNAVRTGGARTTRRWWIGAVARVVPLRGPGHMVHVVSPSVGILALFPSRRQCHFTARGAAAGGSLAIAGAWNVMNNFLTTIFHFNFDLT